MVEEVVEGLAIIAGGIYVDATYGGGGHAKAILDRIGKGRLMVFDQDEEALALVPKDPRIIAIHQNFRHLGRFLRLHGISQVDGILADLGVSSHQVDEAERGFSFRQDARLDMRMDRRQELDAAKILAEYPEDKLQQIFSELGEVTNARTLARTLVRARAAFPITTTGGLASVVRTLVKGNPNRYIAKVFQALRIEVNDELGALQDLLAAATTALRPGGRMVVISFHSLEDRLVKRAFRGTVEKDPDPFSRGTREKPPFRQLNKKPLTPGPAEIASNPRAGSARMRIGERLT